MSIAIKRSFTIPFSSALNAADLFLTSSVASTSPNSGSLQAFGGVGIGGSLWTSTANYSSISGVGHLNSVITSGVWSGTAISTSKGGTGLTSFTIGDILYATSSTTLGKLSAGTAGSVLTSAGVGSTPYWSASTGSSSSTGSTIAIAGINDGDIQYKLGSALGASSNLNYDSSTSTFKITGFPIESVSSSSANVKLLGDSVSWSGNVNGTMLAINTANSYTGDIINAQINGTSKFKVAYNGAVSIGNSFTLPFTDGNANQVLQTNGSGIVSWATVSSGSSTILTTTDNSSTLYLIGTRTNGGNASTALYVNTGISALGNTITATTFSGTATSSLNTASTNIVLDTTSTIYLTGSKSNSSIGSTPVYVLSGVSALGNTITASTFTGSLSGTATSAALVNIDASTSTRYLLGAILNTATGSTQLYVGSGITVGNNFLTAGGIALTNTTASASTTSGALTVVGGAGIGGSVNIGGTLNVSGNLSIVQSTEQFFNYTNNIGSGSTVNLAANTNGGILYVNSGSVSGNWTLNVTGLALTNSYAASITAIVGQGTTAYIPSTLRIAGTAQSINWQGGSAPSGNANKKDVIIFSILSTGTGTTDYLVLGQLVSFG